MQLGFIAHNDVRALEADCRFAASHDFTTLEFNVWHSLAHLDTHTVRDMRRALDAYGLRCSSFGLWGVNHIASDVHVRQTARIERERAIEYAAMLGASVLVLGAGEISHVLDENVYTFAHVMRPSIDAVASHKMHVALYGFHNGFLTTPDACERLWSVVGDVGFSLDVAAIMQAGHDALEFVRRHGKRIRHVHIKDIMLQHGSCIAEPPAGMGDVPWGKVMALLYEAEYRGTLSIAPHGPFWSRPGQRERMLLLSKRYLSPFVLH